MKKHILPLLIIIIIIGAMALGAWLLFGIKGGFRVKGGFYEL